MSKPTLTTSSTISSTNTAYKNYNSYYNAVKKAEKPFVMPKIPTNPLDELELIFKFSANHLKQYLINRLATLNYNVQSEDGFIIATPKSKNTTPVMFLAHMDTVHRELVSDIWYSKDQNKWTAQEGIGGDDRCGIWMILQTIIESEKKPIVLFTEEEEIGGVGAGDYVRYIAAHPEKKPEVNFLIEYDRANSNDAVYYDCDNKEFEAFISEFGFETNYGSYSDISDVAPALEVAAVNLSSGYYKPHTTNEYIIISEMIDNLKRGIKIINTPNLKKYEYVEKVYSKHYLDDINAYDCADYDYYKGRYYNYDDVNYLPSALTHTETEEDDEDETEYDDYDFITAYDEYENPQIVSLESINNVIGLLSIETHDNAMYTSEDFDDMFFDNNTNNIYYDENYNVYSYESTVDAYVKIDNGVIVLAEGDVSFDINNRSLIMANVISQRCFEIILSEY